MKVWSGIVGERADPLRILQVCAPSGVGGLERVVQGLSQGLARRGHEVTLSAVVHVGSPSPGFLTPGAMPGVTIHEIRVKGRGYLVERRAVREQLDAFRPHVIHTHGYRPDLLHGPGARRRGIGTVSTLHGSSRMGGLSHFFEWLQQRAMRRFDAVIAVSRPLAQQLEVTGVPTGRIHLAPNAWIPPSEPLDSGEARRVLGLERASVPVIGWVGRLIPIKGCDLFIEALSRIQAHPWTAVVIGDGPERDRLWTSVREAGLEDRVRFAGAVPEASRLMPAFDIFVLSSRSEGTPMVLLEAMAAGVAPVAFAVGGVPDVIPHDEGGWLVAPRRVDLLSEGIIAVLGSEAERTRAGNRARRHVLSTFAEEAWISLHERLYRGLRL